MKRMTAFLCIFFLAAILSGCGNSTKITVNEGITAEYGNELDYISLYNQEESDDDIRIKEVKGFDKYTLGEQDIVITFIDDNNDTVEQTAKVTVEDTKYPEIKIKKDTITIKEGDSFNASTNIESVSDCIDGEIKKADTADIRKNGYFIKSNVNNKKVGSYSVDITAYDKNGNNATKSYAVTVKEKQKATTTVQKSTKQTVNKTSSTSTGAGANKTGSTNTSTVNKTTGTSKPKPATQTKPTATKKPTAHAPAKKPIGNKVYIAGSGKGTKYHSSPSCSNMNNPIEISLNDAKAQGYTACKKCY